MQVSERGYISSERIHFWTIGTLEGRISFHDSWPQGPCPRVGLEVKIYTFKKCFSTFLLWKQLLQIVGQSWLGLVTLTFGSWSEGQHDLYFMVQWFCLISWRLFDVWTSFFGIMNQYDPRFDLKINVGHCDLYFMVHAVILPCILKTIWYMNIIIWDYESVLCDIWPKIIVCHCDLYFMVQWFCVISWRLFDIWTAYFGIMRQYVQIFDLKLNVGHCDLYFMVQWFYLISWKLTIWCMNIILQDYWSVWSDIWL